MSEIRERLGAALGDRYVVEGELGAGGMATVYLAHDVRHDRKVALKVLRPELAAVVGAERFLAEIKTTANLQHPHILPLHDSGEVDGTVFYVMPYVEGESLRDRLNREKQLPIADAVRIATEVADALDYAHRQDVIHRDIKPENILLHDGRALVADFGIALAMTEAGGTRMTETGMSLGTPQYMSPEQAMGERELDARSDIYALGCVLYEMLAGEPPFTGPTAQAIVAKVLTADPGLVTTYRRTVPPHVEATLRSSLQKLPADRPASAAEFKLALSDAAAATRLTPAVRTVSRRARGGLAIAGLVGVAAGIALGALLFRAAPVTDEVTRVQMLLGDSLTITMVDNHRLALSPDGRRVAFVGSYRDESSLWVRELDAMVARRLPGTDGAFRPFFSPDGGSIGFLVAEAGGADIKVVAAEGGIVRTVVDDSASGWGADWAGDGRIYFSHASNLGLAAVPATGGSIIQISQPQADSGATEHNYPHVLPGNRTAIVQLWRGSTGANAIGAVDLQTGEVKNLMDGTYARYLAPDRLIVGSSDGRLYAVRFDPDEAQLIGDPVPVANAVNVEAGNGTVQFALSKSGTLLYQLADTTGRELIWVDRTGSITPVDASLQAGIQHVSLSLDGRRVAMTILDSHSSSIWVKQLPAGALTRLTFEGEESDRPVWTPDGNHVAYLGTRDGRRLAWVQRADASGAERQAVPGSLQLNEVAFHPNGEFVVVRPVSIAPRSLYVAEVDVDTAPRLLLPTRADNYAATLSPDGRWLAYVSIESGSAEVYVRPFPAVDSARYSISVGGGSEPVWGRTGRELFYRTPRGDVMAVPVELGDKFTHGEPALLFEATGMHTDRYHRAYDVAPDDQRFLMIGSAHAPVNSLVIVFNWREELERFLETSE